MNVLDIKRRAPKKNRAIIVTSDVPADVRFAQLHERMATLNSVVRSQAQDAARDVLHGGDNEFGLHAKIAKLEVAVAELEALVA